jgi:hypothetical protein
MHDAELGMVPWNNERERPKLPSPATVAFSIAPRYSVIRSRNAAYWYLAGWAAAPCDGSTACQVRAS